MANIKNVFKTKKPLFFTVISLIFSSISSLIYFISYERVKVGSGYMTGAYGSTFGGTKIEWRNELRFTFPGLSSILALIIGLAPVILLLICIVKFENSNKKWCFLTAIFVIMCISYLLSSLYVQPPFSSLMKVLIPIGAVLAVLSLFISVRAVPKKLFSFVFVGLYLWRIIPICYTFNFLAKNDYGFANVLNCADMIGIVTLLIALLFYIKENNINHIFYEKLSPEQRLADLKERLDLGAITEEEYKSQRADIISKL